jgi:uncharacterized protein (TIGR00369 family)
MDYAWLLVSKERCLMRAPLTDAVRSPAGCASIGMVMTLVDIGASSPALVACRPDWTATQDLSVYGAGWLAEGPILIDSQIVRVGKKMIVLTADVYDTHGMEDFNTLEAAIDQAKRGDVQGGLTLAANGLITFARLPGSAASGVDDYEPAGWVGEIRHRVSDHSAEGTLYERLGLRVVDSQTGQVELDLTKNVANSIGTINGGAQATLIEVAAEGMRPGLVATDMQIHYLSQVRAGPARSSAQVLRDAADHSVVSVELVDVGNGNQLLTRATVTLVSPPH